MTERRTTTTPPRCTHAFDIAVSACLVCCGTFRAADKPCFVPTKEWPPYIGEEETHDKRVDRPAFRA